MAQTQILKSECDHVMSFELRCDHEEIIPDPEYFVQKLRTALGSYLEDRFDHAWMVETPYRGVNIPFHVCWAHGSKPLTAGELQYRVEYAVAYALGWTLRDYCLDREVDLDEVEEEVRLRVVRV